MLGFMHTWVKEFAKHFEKITVVCLKEGKHNLPKNVQVFSLGKEKGTSKVTQLLRFYKYIWNYRKEYDAVYVHMNQEYVLLGGLLWHMLGKYVTMWRNHHAGSYLTDVASLFCHKIFCTSKFSYTAKYKKTVFMPVGVPTDIFRPLPEVQRKPHSILSIVRISPAKKIEQLIEALYLVHSKGIPFTATLCGKAIPMHKEYETSLHEQVKKRGLEDKVFFAQSVPYEEVPALYAKHDICVNQSPSGMYDKTIFEAMLCETLALSCNENLHGEIDELFLFKEDNESDLANKLVRLLLLSPKERKEKAQKLVQYAQENHSLTHLGERLKVEFVDSK
jgi:glycosyltransferase involved in cell wall biosynthesis